MATTSVPVRRPTLESPPPTGPATVPRALVASDSAILLAGIRVALATEEWPIAGATRSLLGLRGQADRCRADVLVVAPSTSPTPELRQEVADAARSTVVLLWGAGVRVHGHEPLGEQRCIYLSFEAAPSMLTDALREVDGENLVGARTSTRIVGAEGMLTGREGEVLEAVATGACNAEVAERLFVTPETVKSHLRRIYGKLGVSSRSEAVAFYYGHCSSGPERAEPVLHRAS